MNAKVLSLQDIREVPEIQEVEMPGGTLQDELHRHDIPIIPFEEVQEHQRMTLRALRPGAWRFIGPLFRAVSNFCAVFWGATILQEWSKYTAKRIPPWVLLLPVAVVMLSTLSVIVASLAGAPESVLLWICVPLGAFLIGILLSRAERNGARLAEVTSAWVMGRINIRGFGAISDVPHLPERLRMRACEASTIPATRLYVEYLEEDPFVVAVRGHGLFTEKVYIGAWGTNSHFDDI